MQLNGSTGPTITASEPPEPPPRNPDRINASLNKLAESKVGKSLDAGDKTVNNNKSFKTILSLDNSNATTTTNNTFGINSSSTNPINTTPASANSNSKRTIIEINSQTGGHNIITSSSTLSSSSSSSSSGGNITLGSTTITTTSMIPAVISNTNSSSTGITNLSSVINDNNSHHHQQQQQQQQQSQRNSTIEGNYRLSSEILQSELMNGSPSSGIGIRPSDTNNHHHSHTGKLSLSSSTSTSVTTNSTNITLISTAIDKNNANDLLQQMQSITGRSNQNGAQNTNGTGAHLNGQMNTSVMKEPTNGLKIGEMDINIGAIQNKEDTFYDVSRHDDLRFDMETTITSPNDRDTKDQSAIKLRFENEKLQIEIARLRKLLENSPDGAVGGVDLSDSNSYDAHSTDGSSSRVERLESELKAAKTQIAALRAERKKLKSDKADLLAHVKQLCASLQDKEQELRDFIRNYEQRIRETETNNAKITTERERERWSLLKHARDEAERSLALAQQLNARDIQLQRTQEQLQEARRQLSGCLSDQESLLSFAPLTPPSGLIGTHLGQGATTSNAPLLGFNSTAGNMAGGGGNNSQADRGSCSADSGVRGSSDRESTTGDLNLSDGTCENGPCITVDPDSISLVSSQHMYQFGTPKERSPTLSPLNSGAYSSRSVEQLGSPVDPEGPSALQRKLPSKIGTATLSGRTGRGGTWGSISRVFARTRNKNKTAPQESTEIPDLNWSPLSEEGYAEKLRLLREASQIPMDRWRASQVLAWLEVALGMPQYSSRCSENVKSGKVLLELNDTELETGLGLTHPMHRKKIRLAIEEQRRPDLVRYPTIAQLGHTWVASEWLPDIGLPQYAEPFLHSLVDARMLDTLSKKELEKFLGVSRKFHQASIVHGIHVLRIVKYDRQTLAMRRLQSENVDADPIVWTNQRFVRWARSIDLGEYADNLKDSGVHGGLVVLEPSFSGETMATALGIPPAKNIIRRHLCTEFDALVLPARANLGQGIRSGCGVVPITGPGGLQQHFSTSDRRASGSLRISAWKGSQSSLSKAFRFNTTKSSRGTGERSNLGSSTSPTPSYSSSEGGGGGIYATIGPTGFSSSIGIPGGNVDASIAKGQMTFFNTFHIPPPPPPTTAPPPPPTISSSSAIPSSAMILAGTGGSNLYSSGSIHGNISGICGAPPSSLPTQPPPRHRVSAPPTIAESSCSSSSSPPLPLSAPTRPSLDSSSVSGATITGGKNSQVAQYSVGQQQHRRVKSISDIEVVTTAASV